MVVKPSRRPCRRPEVEGCRRLGWWRRGIGGDGDGGAVGGGHVEEWRRGRGGPWSGGGWCMLQRPIGRARSIMGRGGVETSARRAGVSDTVAAARVGGEGDLQRPDRCRLESGAIVNGGTGRVGNGSAGDSAGTSVTLAAVGGGEQTPPWVAARRLRGDGDCGGGGGADGSAGGEAGAVAAATAAGREDCWRLYRRRFERGGHVDRVGASGA